MTNAKDYISVRTIRYGSDVYLRNIKMQLEELLDSKEAISEFIDSGKISTSINSFYGNLNKNIENLRSANQSLFRTLENWLKEFGWKLVFEQNDNTPVSELVSELKTNPNFTRSGTYYLVPTAYFPRITHD